MQVWVRARVFLSAEGTHALHQGCQRGKFTMLSETGHAICALQSVWIVKPLSSWLEQHRWIGVQQTHLVRENTHERQSFQCVKPANMPDIVKVTSRPAFQLDWSYMMQGLDLSTLKMRFIYQNTRGRTIRVSPGSPSQWLA